MTPISPITGKRRAARRLWPRKHTQTDEQDADGLSERIVYFGRAFISRPSLDGFLGTAKGAFSKGKLVGVRDTFNFDFKPRGDYPYGTLATLGVALVRLDASGCAGDVKIPVSGAK